MPRTLTAEDVARVLKSALRAPVDLSYPLPPYETPDQWTDRVLDGVDQLAGGGRLFARDSSKKSLAKTLLRAARQEVAPSLATVPGKVRLLGGLIRNLVDPGRINQGHKGTCAVTSLESFLADRQPAEYARLVTGLLSPAGSVSMANGEQIQRDESSLVWSRTEAWRSPISRVFQVAAMEQAYPELDYRNTIDGHFQVGSNMDASINTGTGVDLTAFNRLLEAISGQRWDTLSRGAARAAAMLARLGLDTSNAPALERDGWGVLTRSLAAGDPVFVTLDTGAPLKHLDPDDFPFVLPHKVRVLAYQEAEERVVYEDPLDPTESWIPGADTRVEDNRGRCSIAREDFERLMDEMSYRPRYLHPPGNEDDA